MSTPFEAPAEDVPADDIYGRTRFTVAMMASLKWIGLFHGLFGVSLSGCGFLSLMCGGVSLIPLVAGTIPPTPGLGTGLFYGIVGMYCFMALVFGALATWLLAAAWNLMRASFVDDATREVEAALRHVVRLWMTLTVAVVLTVLGYAAFTAWLLTNPLGVPPGGIQPGVLPAPSGGPAPAPSPEAPSPP